MNPVQAAQAAVDAKLLAMKIEHDARIKALDEDKEFAKMLAEMQAKLKC
jgi:hypothetical protein